MALGLVGRSAVSVLRALLVGLFYGSIIWGVLPGHRGISWESHLSGLLAGLAMAGLSSHGATDRNTAAGSPSSR